MFHKWKGGPFDDAGVDDDRRDGVELDKGRTVGLRDEGCEFLRWVETELACEFFMVLIQGRLSCVEDCAED